MSGINKMEVVKLLKEEFPDKDGYIIWDRTIQKTNINDNGEITSEVYRSNQSSIHYNYKINMTATISDTCVQIQIDTETSASNGDPYCYRGMIMKPNNYKFTKNIREFKTNEEIVKYIDKTFYKHYFRIESRN
jgi:hypothetical protein